jgi:Holliday junction resolvase
MSGARHRRKGDRIEREIVAKHIELGIHSERYPLSGASRFRGSGHDVDVYAFGRDTGPLVAECKARKSGGGFVQLEKWLGEYDALFLRRNNADPLVILPWARLGATDQTGASMTSASWRKAILLNRSALLAAWPRHFPQHDFMSLRLVQAPLTRADSYWEGEDWKRAARAYHEDRMRQRRW